VSLSSTISARLADGPSFNDPAFYGLDLAEINGVIADLHRTAPVFWCEPGRFWVISKYADQRHIGSHPELFSNAFGFSLGNNAADPGALIRRLPQWAQDTYARGGLSRAETRGLIARASLSLGDPELTHIVASDPPLHTYQRKIWSRAFSGRVIRGLAGAIEEICDELLGSVQPGEVHDFVELVAAPMPALTVAHILGVPRSDRLRFIPWSQALVDSAGIDPDAEPERAREITVLIEEFFDYSRDLLDRRRADPQDDFVSRIVTADVDGRSVDDANVLMFIGSMIGGAHDTSKSLISQTMQAFSERPEQRAILVEQPELVDNAVEEVLRCYPIAWALFRTALEDTEIRGQAIAKGDYMMLFYLAANRDPEVWERPYEFDVTRVFDSAHQTFGFGEHACPGSALARLEARIVLKRMLARFPNWELASTPVRALSWWIQGLRSLELRF
jgi:cytochrome P450